MLPPRSSIIPPRTALMESNMHVAMISGEYPPRWGGMGSTVYHLSSRLADMGHKISVITRKSRGEPPSLNNVEIIQVPWLKVPLEFTRSYGKSALKALVRLHSENPVDVVHLHCPMVSWNDTPLEVELPNIRA